MADLEWTVNPGSQEEFLFGDLAGVREILFAGEKGGGKTGAIGPKAYLHINEHPKHARVLILRETHPELMDLIDLMRPQCLAQGARWHEQRKTWTFPDGAKIRFGHLSDGCDPYWGQEYSLIIIDELTRCIETEADYIKLLGSLRNSKGVPCQVCAMSNPGGPGHNWVKARFMGVPPRTVHTDPDTGLERVFIPGILSENEQNLGPTYRQTLEQLPEAERNAYLKGDWDAFTGAVFRLEAGVHTWTWRQFHERMGVDAIPTHWKRYRSYDHGFARPGACYWYAVDEEGRAFVYREYYTVAKDGRGQVIPNEGARIEPRAVAKNIAEKSGDEEYVASWTGPDLFYEVRQDQMGGVKISSHFVAEGLNFRAWTANKGSRRAGKEALHQRMAYEKDAAGNVIDWPHIVFIAEECPHAIRTIPALDRDPHDPELWDTDGEDHAADSVMGFCKMNPRAAVKPKKPTAKWTQRMVEGDSRWTM